MSCKEFERKVNLKRFNIMYVRNKAAIILKENIRKAEKKNG